MAAFFTDGSDHLAQHTGHGYIRQSRVVVHRFRLEVGTLADVGVSHRGRRSASQLRISLFADSAKSWGARVMLLVSPTRR